MSQDSSNRSGERGVGKQRDISDVARQAGLLIPVYVTSTVWDNWVTPDRKSIEDGENEGTRVRSVLDKLLYYIRVHRQTSRSNLIYFPVPLTKDGKSENVQLLSHLGPVDQGDDRPCITIMMPEDYDSLPTTAH